MLKTRSRVAVETDPDMDIQIQEIADKLLRISRRLPIRLTGEGYFLESVALVLKREHRLVKSLECAVGHYDRLVESMCERIDHVLKPPEHVIDVAFDDEVAEASAADS